MQIFLIVFMVALAATFWARARFLKIYRQEIENVPRCGLTGEAYAQRLLATAGLPEVKVVKGRRMIADSYSPKHRRVELSREHFSGKNYSALAMAALQVGKAIQHAEGHRPLLWRLSAVRMTTYFSLPLVVLAILAALLGGSKTIFPLLLLLWSILALWNLITVPTELDAAERVKKIMSRTKILKGIDETVGVERVMGAASSAHVDGLYTLSQGLLNRMGIRGR